MSIDRFESRFKNRSDLMDQITPNNVVQANVSVPAGEWKPAGWLPVVWQNLRSKDYFVMSSGKVVSFFADGRIVPSGLLERAYSALNGDSVILTYKQMDQDARVIDITTGKFVELGGLAQKEVTLLDFVAALRDLGLISRDHVAFSYDSTIVDNPATDVDEAAAELNKLRSAVAECISSPVGVLAYDVFVWAGDDPANLHFTNYQKQHLIQFFTDIQVKVPQVASAAIETVALNGLQVVTGAQLAQMARYAGLPVENVVGLQIGIPSEVAANTKRTPVSFINLGAGTLRHRDGVDLLAKEGDWMLDETSAMLLVFKQGGAALPAVFAGSSIKFYSYVDAVSTQERMVHFVGVGRPGDYVTFDGNSNFKAVPASEVGPHLINGLIVGRLLHIFKEPRSLLERVRTGFQADYFDASSKMPGSATGGFSDLITLSKEIVADQIAVINIKCQ
jgi:hypothetical protein